MFRNKRQQTCLLPHYALLCYTIYAMLCLCKCARIRADINTQICHETCICSHFASASSISTTQKKSSSINLKLFSGLKLFLGIEISIFRWDLLCPCSNRIRTQEVLAAEVSLCRRLAAVAYLLPFRIRRRLCLRHVGTLDARPSSGAHCWDARWAS